MNATIARTGRTWYGTTEYSVSATDDNGTITFNGYRKGEAEEVRDALNTALADGTELRYIAVALGYDTGVTFEEAK